MWPGVPTGMKRTDDDHHDSDNDNDNDGDNYIQLNEQTKHEVKITGYWPSSFFCVLMDLDGVKVHKHPPKKNEANIQPS